MLRKEFDTFTNDLIKMIKREKHRWYGKNRTRIRLTKNKCKRTIVLDIGGSNMVEETMFSGESKNIEYKVTVPDKSEKYMKTVVAFANGRGGKIVFGIEDKTLEVVGMDEDSIYKTMDAITNAISDSCEPAIRPDVAMQTVKDKTVIVVEIFPGAECPYYIKSQGIFDGTYVRVTGTTRHVEDYMLRELMLEGKNRYFDSEICQNMDIRP